MSQNEAVNAGHIAAAVDGDRVTNRLAEMVRTPSENPPGEEAAVAALVASSCRDLGLEVTIHEKVEGRPNVVARWHGGEGPTLCFCSHFDVVPIGDPALWERAPFGADIEDGLMYGRGTSDAKGPIAAALEAVAALRISGWEPRGTLELALVADEETMGFMGAGYLVGEGIIRPDVAVVGEPTSLRVVRAQRGASWLRVVTRGVAGHGSAPERGVNAIKHMSEIVLHLEETLPDITHEILGGPSINVGRIGGGEKVNIIPASCWIEVDRRSIPGETEATLIAGIEAAISLARARFHDIDATVTVEQHADPYEVPAGSPVVVAAADSVAEVTGTPAELIGFRGASDARFIADTGTDVIVLGPGDIGLAHTAQESIELAELERCAAVYALTFAKLLSGAPSLRGAT